MTGNPLWRRYARLEQRVEELPRAQTAVVMGTVWFLVWTTLEVFLGGQSLPTAALLGGIGAVVFGGLWYAWGPG